MNFEFHAEKVEILLSFSSAIESGHWHLPQ